MAEYPKEVIEGLRQAVEGLQIAINGLLQAAEAGKPTKAVTVAPSPAASPARDEVVSIKRVARALNLNAATIRKMSARGDFPAPLKIPIRKQLYLRSDLDAFWRERLGGLDNSGNWNGSRFPLKPIEPVESPK